MENGKGAIDRLGSIPEKIRKQLRNQRILHQPAFDAFVIAEVIAPAGKYPNLSELLACTNRAFHILFKHTPMPSWYYCLRLVKWKKKRWGFSISMEQELKNRKFMQNTSIRNWRGDFHEEWHGVRACGLNYVRSDIISSVQMEVPIKDDHSEYTVLVLNWLSTDACDITFA